MPTKSHERKINEIIESYERLGFICKKQFPLYNPKENNFSLIDVACFKNSFSRAFEVEVSGKQVLKNGEDLSRFKSIFKNSKVCQLTTDKNIKDCSDFRNRRYR